MSETKYLFERVKKTATKAIQAERKGDLKSAFDLFLKAAELLNKLITVEPSARIRDSYYSKAKQYIARAKEIKALIDGPSKIADIQKDLPDVKRAPSPTKKDLPKTTDKKEPLPPPPPPPPPKEDLPPPPPKTTPSKQSPPPPPFPEDLTKKIMRGEEGPAPSPTTDQNITKTREAKAVPPPPKKEIELPTKTTFELLYDEGKYRECVLECAKSVEAELRVRLGLFDEHLTLGMLIERGINKGLDSLTDFKYVNILINRIEHENYRPKQTEALKAVEITTKILLS